jgi:hypothetical protein
MFKKTALTMAVTVALGLAGSAQAYVIDDFTTGAQAFTGLYGVGAVASGTAAGSMATLERDIWIGVTRDDNGSPLGGASGGVSTGGVGTLSLSANSLASANMVVNWDGVGTVAVPDTAPTGFNGSGTLAGQTTGAPTAMNLAVASPKIDLTDSGLSNGGFLFDVIKSDGAFFFELIVVSDSGTSSFAGNAPPSGVTEFYLPFTLFSNSGLSYFQNVHSLSLEIVATDVDLDFTISKLQTVPEPATLALLGLGLAGLGAGARRRNRT